MNNPLREILARVKQHAGKPYSLQLSAEATFALEYVTAQEQRRMKEFAGKRTYVDGKLIRANGIQRTDILNRALLAELKRYHEMEHNGDEDEEHPALELVGIVKPNQPCPVCKELNRA